MKSLGIFSGAFFNVKPPARQKPMQDWCLNDLLMFLKSDSFEPLDVVSLKTLTQKTLIGSFVIGLWSQDS